MPLTQLVLAGRERDIAEPVFKSLRRIIAAYNRLAGEGADADKVAAVETLLTHLLAGEVSLKQLTQGELSALLQAVPDICGLKPAPRQGVQPTDNWGDVYAHLSACCGWTYDYIDNHMTLSRLNEYRAYWSKHPPTHQLVAAYLGYEYQDKQSGSSFLAAIAAQAKSKQAHL